MKKAMHLLQITLTDRYQQASLNSDKSGISLNFCTGPSCTDLKSQACCTADLFKGKNTWKWLRLKYFWMWILDIGTNIKGR